MTIPVFKLSSNTYSGENVVLDQEIFNNHVRKDIIHRVYMYNREYNHRTFKWVKAKGDVSGSNKKPFQQKKTGRAPQGDKRAPNLYHGGRAHGARPRNYYFPLNKKIRLLGLKSLLTSKFLENAILVFNSEKIENKNPRELDGQLRFLKDLPTIFVTAAKPCENFEVCAKQIKYINHLTADKLNVEQLINCKYLVFSVEGLSELVNVIKGREKNYFRNKKIPIDPAAARKELPIDKFKFDFDPNKELELHTPVLKGSYEVIKKNYMDMEGLITSIKEKRAKAEEEKIRAKEEKKKMQTDELYNDDSMLDKRKNQLKKERRLKALKDTRRLEAKKKKKTETAQSSAGAKK
jgi:large subunit ribosomal protein L4